MTAEETRKMVACNVLWAKGLGEITQYTIVEADGRYAASWSEWRWPVQGAEGDEVPANDIDDGTNGIEWHDSMAEAVQAMRDLIKAIGVTDGEWAEEALEEIEAL